MGEATSDHGFVHWFLHGRSLCVMRYTQVRPNLNAVVMSVQGLGVTLGRSAFEVAVLSLGR